MSRKKPFLEWRDLNPRNATMGSGGSATARLGKIQGCELWKVALSCCHALCLLHASSTSLRQKEVDVTNDHI